VINHFHVIQLRITGTGTLKSKLYSLPDRAGVMRSEDLENLNMTTQTSREPVLLANFMEERAKLKIYTTEIDEIFTIRKITVFIKPTYTSDPM